jgi:glutaminase
VATTETPDVDGHATPLAERAIAVRTRIEELHRRHAGEPVDVVSYYPPEARSRPEVFGLSGVHVSGVGVSVGDTGERFPLQSISKVFTYALALEDNGRDAVLARVGVEPSGDPYNSITFDDAHHRPYNPMINSGALVAASLVHGRSRAERVERLVARLRAFAGTPEIDVDRAILDDQLRRTDHNLGLAYVMRALGMLDADVDVEDVVAVYLAACSVTTTTDELAVMGATLANGGLNPITGERAMPAALARDVISVTLTCGMYDAAGQWFYDVGIPAKSGVSGAIVAALPERIGIAVYSPGLDVHGNSVRGVNICRDLSAHFGLHVFAAERPDAAFT